MRITAVLMVVLGTGCISANAELGDDPGAADVYETVENGALVTVVNKSIRVEIVNLSHTSSSDLFMDDLCRQLTENVIAYNGNFTFRRRDRLATETQGRGGTSITCTVQPSWSSVSSSVSVIAVVDDLPQGFGTLDAAGVAFAATSLGAARAILIEDDFARRDTTATRRRALVVHEVGHLLGMIDDYSSHTVMGDLTSFRAVTTPGQRLVMYGGLALGESLEGGDGRAQIAQLLRSENAGYDESKLP